MNKTSQELHGQCQALLERMSIRTESMSEAGSFREVPREILELCKPSFLDICSPDDQIERCAELEQQGNISVPNWETIAMMVMDEDLGYHSCDDTLLNEDRLQDDESRKYPCLNLHSRKIKAKMLQENQTKLTQMKVKETPPRRFEEAYDLEGEVRELGDFEIGEDELLPKHKARIHYIPEYLWEDSDTINPTNEFKSPNLQLAAVHQGDLTRSETEVMNLVRDIAVHKYTIKDLITAQDSFFMVRMCKLMFKNNGQVGRFPEPCSANMARKIKGFFQATWRYLRYVKGVLCRTKNRTEA